MQELNRKFGNICISPRPQAAPGVRAPLHVAKELEHQARQNFCTLNFSAVFNHTILECSSVMDRYRDKSTIKKAKHQILKGANPERSIKNAYETTRDYIDIWDKRIQIQQRVLECQSKAMTSGWTIRPTFDQSSVSWYNCVRSLTTSRNRLNLTLLYVSQYPHIFLYFGQFPELSFNKLTDFSRILSLFTNYRHIYRKWVLLVACISRKHR